ATPEEISATQWQLDELDRRSAEYAKNPSSGIPWEEVKHNILSRSAQYHISIIKITFIYYYHAIDHNITRYSS
ncbi:MAG: addiction module protein, partial [Chlorobium sp.]